MAWVDEGFVFKENATPPQQAIQWHQCGRAQAFARSLQWYASLLGVSSALFRWMCLSSAVHYHGDL